MPQQRHLCRRQIPPFTRSEAAVAERPDSGAPQFPDGVTDRFQHAPDLPVATLANGDDQDPLPIVRPPVQRDHVGTLRAAAVERNASTQLFERVVTRHARDAGFVGALDLVPRMRERCREVAVVGEQQQPFGVVIETANRVDVLAHAFQRSITVRRRCGSDRVVT